MIAGCSSQHKQLTTRSVAIRAAINKADVASFAVISLQYVEWLTTTFGVNLSYQKFQQEIDNLPGDFAAPKGVILLASAALPDNTRQAIGALALRPLSAYHVHGDVDVELDRSSKTCEMKRLYVLPDWQQHGVGRMLAATVVEAARQMGYQRMVLDTLERLTSANQLYKSLGFQRCSTYNGNPLPDACFWEMML